MLLYANVNLNVSDYMGAKFQLSVFLNSCVNLKNGNSLNRQKSGTGRRKTKEKQARKKGRLMKSFKINSNTLAQWSEESTTISEEMMQNLK